MKIRIFWFFWIIAVGIFTLFVPPFQKPDEPRHYYRAMALATGQFSCTKSSSASGYFPLSKTVYEFPRSMQTDNIVMRFDAKFPIGLLKERFPYRSDTKIVTDFQTCALPFIGYMPFAAAALLVSPADNLLLTFYAMRVSAALLLILAVYVGYRRMPKQYKLLYLFLAANPMFLHQGTSISYDAIINILVMILLPVWLVCMAEEKLRWKSVAALFALTLATVAVKPGYYLLVGLVVPVVAKIPFRKTAIPLGVAALTVLYLVIFTPSVHETFFNTFLTNKSPQVSIVFHDPWYFLTVIARTITESHGRLVQGLLGLFGWLDYQLPLSFMLLYVFVGGFVSYEYIRMQKKSMSAWIIIFLGLICATTVVLIFYLFYRNATPSAYYIVEGMQGRYFLPLLPITTIFLLEGIVLIKVRGHLWALYSVVGLAAVGILSYLTYTRYYDYSKNFSNPDELVRAIKQNAVDLKTLTPIEINRPRSFVYTVTEGYKIGGFQMIVANELDVDVPYKVSLKDGMCEKIMYRGYVSRLRNRQFAHLKGDSDIVITQYLPITALRGQNVCITLEPFAAAPNPVYMQLLGDKGQPILRFLYIAK